MTGGSVSVPELGSHGAVRIYLSFFYFTLVNWTKLRIVGNEM